MLRLSARAFSVTALNSRGSNLSISALAVLAHVDVGGDTILHGRLGSGRGFRKTAGSFHIAFHDENPLTGDFTIGAALAERNRARLLLAAFVG